MSSQLREEIEDLLYLEAQLLDGRRFNEWLELFTDDLRYWAPVRDSVLGNKIDEEVAKPGESAYFDDTKQTLKMRVARLYTGQAWAETPPSRTRHFVSNIRIAASNGPEVEVDSYFLAYRTRLETDQDMYVGLRQDLLRRVEGQLKIARRTITLDQTVLLAKNISIFL